MRSFISSEGAFSGGEASLPRHWMIGKTAAESNHRSFQGICTRKAHFHFANYTQSLADLTEAADVVFGGLVSMPDGSRSSR